MRLIKYLMWWFMLLLVPALSCATTVQLIGTLVDVSGAALNGRACFQLPVNAIDTSQNRALTTAPVCYSVNNGVLPAFANIVPNDVIQPSSTYYVATFYNRASEIVYNANYSVPTGAGTFNLGLAVPTTVTTSNISYLNPALLNVTNIWTAVQTFPLNSIAVNELVPGTNGQFLGTVAGTVQWTSATGTTIQVNAAATANTVNFGNLPAASANNILGVWQYASGNASVQLPMTGNGAKGVSGTGTYNSGHSTVIDASGNIVDSGFAGATVQFVRKTAGTCTTGSNSYDSCTDVLTWPSAFIDNSYAVNCTGIGGSDPRGYWQISAHGTTTVTFKSITGGTNPVNFSEIHCVGVR
jgi:hypothetical protein